MKITELQLKQIIKEEVEEVLSEAQQQVQFLKSSEWKETLTSLGDVLKGKGFYLESQGGNLSGMMYQYRKDFDDGSKMRLKIVEDLR